MFSQNIKVISILKDISIYVTAKLSDERGFISVTPADIVNLFSLFKKENEKDEFLDLPLPLEKSHPSLIQKIVFYIGDKINDLPINLGLLLKFFIRLRNSHADIMHDAMHSVPKCRSIFNIEKTLEYTQQPDIKSLFTDIKWISEPEKITSPIGAYEHFYNPYAKGDRGGGKEAVEIVYEALINSLSIENNLLASENAGKLSHYLADICIPYHALGELENDEWKSKKDVEHAQLEIQISMKHFAERVTPKYIRRGIIGILRRFTDEAKISNKMAQKNEFSKFEQRIIYKRAVQLNADTFYTALINANLLTKK